MNPEEIEEMIYAGIRMVNAEQSKNILCSPNTPLFGETSELDSLALATVLFEAEVKLEAAGHPINLADDEAIGANPWSTVATLRDYIVSKL